MTTVQARIKKSQKQEREYAKASGGRVRPGSGSQRMAKGDSRNKENLTELKRTDRKSFTLKLVELEKIRGEALIEGRVGLLVFELGGRSYTVMETADHLEREQRLSGEAGSG